MKHEASSVSNVRDAVVFWVLPGMNYSRRMLMAFGLILLGLLLQWYSGEVFAGVFPLIAGNALLLVKGYDNRVEFAGFSPSSQWQKVERSRLAELKDFDRKVRRWDRSFIDITNGWGIFTFVLLVFLLMLMHVGFTESRQYRLLDAIPVDMAILFLPHWFTGTRRVLRLPGLMIKSDVLSRVLREVDPESRGDKVEVLMLLKGKDSKLPDDIKIKIEPAHGPEGFLGLYGQVVINAVQGKSYPYFYVVLVARPGNGIRALARAFDPPEGMVVELRNQDGVEVLVIRQHTTRRSGYHTKPERVRELLEAGLQQMHGLTDSA
ncbi:hypothetical protein [Thiolapillus brandeum]|uniref:Uncharacterized protein n=1 Tax=Thiolapillus brandeum TaxID=1076588 RepID=A0A7U6GL23_9GAMM|nr:hypothetical protein [Thiolapillus brandeum]BAO45643.1 conserved hypothetical protein [Thiolapillus brandeum]